MINLETINREILELQKQDTTYATCERLAWLFVIKDHMTPEEEKPVTGRLSGSDFMRAASGVDVAALLAVLDDHLQAVRAIYPEEYKAVVDRVRALKKA